VILTSLSQSLPAVGPRYLDRPPFPNIKVPYTDPSFGDSEDMTEFRGDRNVARRWGEIISKLNGCVAFIAKSFRSGSGEETGGGIGREGDRGLIGSCRTTCVES
jgi:hypothetical protein